MKKPLILILSILITCCSSDDDNSESDPIYGCTDEKSLTFDSMADTDDDSCIYSDLTLYARYNFFQNIPITNIDISIDGEYIGSIANGFIWPNGPGNCSSTGTVQYQFQNSESIDWNATIFLANGQTISSSGTKSPNRSIECIKISVTN